MSLIPSYLESRVEGSGGIFVTLWMQTPERLDIFFWNLNHANKTSLESFWDTQVWNLRKSDFDNCLVFFYFLLLFFANFFPYFINYVIKTKYILLGSKAPWSMSAKLTTVIVMFWDL